MALEKIGRFFGKAFRRKFGKRDPSDMSPADLDIIRAVKPYTMTTRVRLYALIQAVRYVVRCNIPGDIVECGVWKGGSVAAAARTLIQCGDVQRQLWLYDTFDGMPEPTVEDIRSTTGEAASEFYLKTKNEITGGSAWCYSSLAEVKQVVSATGYPEPRLQFVRGKVEETLLRTLPVTIAILRLDTDFYHSTQQELTHLFPRLIRGGVLILDDYGAWQGCRRAVDEYFAEPGRSILLNRLDESCRIGVKTFA
jgi:hypothetical protein